MSRCPEFDALPEKVQDKLRGIAGRFSQTGEEVWYDGPAIYGALSVCLGNGLDLPGMPPDFDEIKDLLSNEDTRELYLNGDIK